MVLQIGVTIICIFNVACHCAKILIAALLLFSVLRRVARCLARLEACFSATPPEDYPAMPRYDRFQQHGDLAPYLDEHPGLFGLYKHSQFPPSPMPDRLPMPSPLPIPRIWTSKDRRDRGEQHREQAIVWLDPPLALLPDSPPEVVSSPSPPTPTSPLPVCSVLPTEFLPRETPRPPLPQRVPTVEDRIHSATLAEHRKKLRQGAGPRFIREDEVQQQLARERHRSGDQRPRAWRPPTPDPRGPRLATFAERARAIQQQEKEKEERRQRRREETVETAKHRDKDDRKRGYESSPQSSKERSRRTHRPPSAKRSRRMRSPPPPVPPLGSYFSPPTPVSPQYTTPPHTVPVNQRQASRVSNPRDQATAFQPASAKPRLERKNAIKRSSRFFQAPPEQQTPPETPLPELSRFDRLLDTISKLTLASSVHLAPSHSHIYSGTPLRTLPHDMQTKLTALHAYLRLSPTTLLPDQDSPAARWASPFRLFPHIRASDNLAGFDGLALHPPEAARGTEPMAARWRVIQQFGRDPDTHPRREYLPSLIALIAASELVKHLRACTARRAADWVASADAVRRNRERQREAEVRSGQHQASKHDHSHRHRLRRKGGHPDLNVHPLDSGPDPISKTEHNVNKQPIPLPPPLTARMRKLERVETRLRWQVALVGEALWGNGSLQGLVDRGLDSGQYGASVPAKIRALTEALGQEGFLAEYDWHRGSGEGSRRRR